MSETEARTGYMCLVDFEHELGEASGGTKIYESIDDIKASRSCVEACGIAEVEVRLLRVVQEPVNPRPTTPEPSP